MKRRCVTCGHDEYDEDGKLTHTLTFCWVDGCESRHVFLAETLVPTSVGSPE